MLRKITNSKTIAFIGSITSIVAFFLTYINKYVPLFTKVLPYIPYVISVLLLITIVIYYQENLLLRTLVHNGERLTYNKVTVIVDIKNKVYNLSFEKRYDIISNHHPGWFKRQFYCNKHLDDNEQARHFYSENTPTWASLHVFANMKYKRQNEKKFSLPVRLRIIPITDNSYYIPFHIHYKGIESDSQYIHLGKGTQVILNYGYQISANLWGSYLNRSLSFFGEEAKVVFQYSGDNSETIEVKLYELSAPDGKPELIRDCNITSLENNQVTFEIDLPRESNGRYRVSWDSQKLLGIANTPSVADESKITDY